MIQHKLFFTFLVCFMSLCLVAQEICDNGIDDDGDGLIDLNDDECACNGVDIILPASLFPNPSFEDNSCSPGFGKANCADGWVNPSEGSPDYYDRCGAMQHFLLPIATCPVPEGDNFFGITDIFENSLLRKEYVGTKLTQPMEAGEDYILSFWVGFVVEPEPDWSSPPVNFGIFGNTDVNATDVPYRGLNCPTSASVDTFGNPINPWDELDQVFVSDADGLGWTQVKLEFIAGESYSSILIGPSCAMPVGVNYYFLDNIVLSKRQNFSNDFIIVRSGQACSDDLVLEVPLMPGLSYQWYRDGIALIGQTGTILSVPAIPDGNGSYVCSISNVFGCNRSTAFIVDETQRQPEILGPAGWCPGDAVVLRLRDNYISYDWAGQGIVPEITVTSPDLYAVTVVDSDGCILEASYDLVRYADVQFTYTPTKETAFGAQDGSIRINHESGVSNPGVQWWDMTTANPHTNLEQGTYCVTVTADERCPAETCIDLEIEIQPIFVTPTIGDVRCYDESNGLISLDVLGGLDPIAIEWEGHPEWDGQTILTNLEAGIYHVIIEDVLGTLVDTTFEVLQPDVLVASVNSSMPTCHDTDDGSIWVYDVSGGNGGYQYFWNGSNDASSDRIDNINGGDFDVRIEDMLGCSINKLLEVTPPDAITTKIEIEHPYCIGADDGSIHLLDLNGGTEPYRYFLDELEVYDSNIFNLAGAQTYSIKIVDANNCEFNQDIELINQTTFDVDLGTTQTIEEFYSTYIQAASNTEINEYNWTTASGEFKICTDCSVFELLVTESDLVTLYARSIAGCAATDTVSILMTPSKRVYIPNAYTPNDDGTNDDFDLFNTGEVDQVSYFKVFNRQGVMIFEIENVSSTDAMKYWNDSMDAHNFDSGTYVYILGLKFKDGSARQVQGDISVIR